jgi:DNA-binding CsgD family transcriptional regulator/catechol 2,3-dioxygenase-like lactoylglutathione lyase family enzyme
MARRGRPSHPDVLTPAEWQVVNGVRHGMSNRSIARRRGTSLDATRFHVANILDKLGLRRREALRHWPGIPADSALARRPQAVTTPIQLGQIGQISMVVDDFERAVAFYKDTLRLPHLFTFGELAFFDCGGTRLFVTRPENGQPAGNSVLYFSVPDIHAAAAELQGRGVTFEAEPHLIHRHEDGVEEWMAFFHGPEGNIHALMSRVAPG